MNNRRHARRGRTALGGALLLLGAVLTACDTRPAEAQALDNATANARSNAVRTADDMAALLRTDDAPKTTEQLVNLIGIGPDGAYAIIFARELRADGTVIADVAIHALGHAPYTEAHVRMCVRLAGKPERKATVTIADTPCSPSLSGRSAYGPVDAVVHYT